MIATLLPSPGLRPRGLLAQGGVACLPRPRLAPGRRAHSRSLQVVRASKVGSSQPEPALPYAEALQRREYELWQRQAALYDQLLAQHEAERQHWAAERERWAAQEAGLRQEISELRAQLHYLLSAGRGVAPDARSSAASSAASSVYAQPPATPQPLPGRPQAQLPVTGAVGLSPSELVGAVVDAVRSGALDASQPPVASGSSSGSSSSSSAAAAEGVPLPRYAMELAAAVAAVDELDVLSENLDFSALADRLLQAQPAAQAAQAPPAPAAAAPPQPVPAPVSAAAAPAAAEVEEPAGPAVAPGPRPTLVSGSDDIYWMNELHRSLVETGYYPGDDDIEDFFFGESTFSAVLTLQACEGLPENGVVDEAVWEALVRLTGTPATHPVPGAAPTAAAQQPAAAAAAAEASAGKPSYQALFEQVLQQGAGAGASEQRTEELVVSDEVVITDSVQSVPGGGLVETITITEEIRVSTPEEARTSWPVLMEGDGGKDVHALHVVLQQEGFYPSDDDIRWWQFGDSTLAALKTFQVCSKLPESGVCDPATWRALLGAGAVPADIAKLRSEDSADEDLASSDRVWLMGEQRWEDKKRLRKP